MGNDKHSILEALISLNDSIWGKFHMHPLKTNMHLKTAAAARARGGLISQEEEEQLQYADMLIDVSMNCNSAQCQVVQDVDDNISILGLPFMKYYTEADHNDAVQWLYPGGQLDFSATILCCNDKSVDMWNSVAQKMNPSQEHILRSKDNFSEVDYPKGHLKKISQLQCLMDLGKMVYPTMSYF
jgi:hypothetical protein